jgi:tetratricopeptide (TPR) repeat protein
MSCVAKAKLHDIANQASQSQPNEETRLNAHRPVNAEAHSVSEGTLFLYKFNTESKKSGHFFEEAIAKDPEYALAYAGLAIYYLTVEDQSSGPIPTMFKAEAAAQKALALDSQLAEGHHALAAVHLYYSWDWATAERELKLALEFNPNLSEAHNAYGDYFKVMGQYEQAVAEYTKAQKLDPLKPILSADLALALIVVQRYEEAVEAARKALEVDPDFYMAHYAIALAKEQQGDYRQAAQNGMISGGRQQKGPGNTPAENIRIFRICQHETANGSQEHRSGKSCESESQPR